MTSGVALLAYEHFPVIASYKLFKAFLLLRWIIL
jgi:hypothetical protein